VNESFLDERLDIKDDGVMYNEDERVEFMYSQWKQVLNESGAWGFMSCGPGRKQVSCGYCII
jgi:hypothetical protein